jgi:glycerol-3-phosphate dehydrogenase
VRELREKYDLLVVGGGINGTGIARDAAGRGLSVLLCEPIDSRTSFSMLIAASCLPFLMSGTSR